MVLLLLITGLSGRTDRLPACLPVCLPARLHVCLFVSLSACLPACLSACSLFLRLVCVEFWNWALSAVFRWGACRSAITVMQLVDAGRGKLRGKQCRKLEANTGVRSVGVRYSSMFLVIIISCSCFTPVFCLLWFFLSQY